MWLDPQSQWWQAQTLNHQQVVRLQIGPLVVYLQRKTGEWWLHTEQLTEPEQNMAHASYLPEWPLHKVFSRYVFTHEPLQFCLTPLLQDRPVVVKTRQPVYLPVGEEVTFYISSPVVIRLELKQPDILLQELPTQRLSDTWFGPNTQAGELCYADKTQARHSKEELPARAHRAITPIRVKNNSSQMMSIEKLSLPLPFLSLYGLPDGSLWTDLVQIDHQNDAELSRLNIHKQMPPGHANAIRLSRPRQAFEKHGLFRVFSDLFQHTERS
ncbi:MULTISPECIES: DUF432 domain-containing protein [Rheinheimera]|uniref:DUF432 domain-containing protein n=1 Tax=Rheinheimera marina TaxID=1774958 RepID=A0ABV9JLZ8_9GAMM